MEMTLFIIFAAICIISSLFVVLARSPIRSAISLIINFFAMGAVYVIMNAEFVALMQVLVYAGAIMVLFLFIIMLLDVKNMPKESVYYRNNFFGVLTLVILFFIVVFSAATVAYKTDIMSGIKSIQWMFVDGSNTKAIGYILFNKYLLPFEITSLLLLVAAIGIIVLGKKKV